MNSDDVGVVGDFQPVLAGLWREACHHIEIGDFAVTVAKILTEYMPMANCWFGGWTSTAQHRYCGSGSPPQITCCPMPGRNARQKRWRR